MQSKNNARNHNTNKHTFRIMPWNIIVIVVVVWVADGDACVFSIVYLLCKVSEPTSTYTHTYISIDSRESCIYKSVYKAKATSAFNCLTEAALWQRQRQRRQHQPSNIWKRVRWVYKRACMCVCVCTCRVVCMVCFCY